MYRSNLNTRDKGGAIAAVAAIHVALLSAFLHLSGRVDFGDPQRVLRVFDVKEVPPPPPPQQEVPKPAERQQKPKEEEAAAALLGVAEATVAWRMHEVRRLLSAAADDA